MFKNVASQVIGAQIIDTAGANVTGGTTTVYYVIDNGTQGTGSTATHKGNGYWGYSPSQSETNGDHIAYTFSNNGASAVEVTLQVYTEDKDASTRLISGARAIAYGTCGTGGSHSTTTVYATAVDPAITVADQYKGRNLIFLSTTTSTNLRSQGCPIFSNTTGTASAFTFGTATAGDQSLTNAPTNGDVFGIF